MMAKVDPIENSPQSCVRGTDKEWEQIHQLGLCFRCKSNVHKSFQDPTLQKVKYLINAFNAYLGTKDNEGIKEESLHEEYIEHSF